MSDPLSSFARSGERILTQPHPTAASIRGREYEGKLGEVTESFLTAQIGGFHLGNGRK